MTWKDVRVQIPGEPVGQGRPRFTKSGHAYKDKKSASYENLIALAFREKYPDWKAVEDPVRVYIRATYPTVPSWSKRKKLMTWLRWSTPKTTTPDLDNLIKAALDGLSRGDLWKNDSQVVYVDALKIHSDNEFNGLTITVVNYNSTIYDHYDEMTTKELQAEFDRQKAEEEEEAKENEVQEDYSDGSCGEIDEW